MTVTSPAPVSAASGTHRRVLELDGLRAFAILPVMFYHCCPSGHWFSELAKPGWMGVDLFFVLSGFLITGILVDTVERPHYYKNFIARRTIRIFPLYYVALLILIVSTRFMLDPHTWILMKAWGVQWFFVYLGNFRLVWLSHWPPAPPFGPLWSLQVEEQYYLLFPLAVWLLSRRNLMRLLIGCVFGAVVLRILFFYFLPQTPDAAYVLMPARMDALALGGIVALLVRSRPAFLKPSRVAWLGAVTGVVFFGMYLRYRLIQDQNMVMRTMGYTVLDLLCACIVCWLILSPKSKVAWVLRWKPLVYTGTIAYGLYLLHLPAAWALRSAVGHLISARIPERSLLSIPLTFCAAYVVASLSWFFFEKPILKLKDRFTTGKPVRASS